MWQIIYKCHWNFTNVTCSVCLLCQCCSLQFVVMELFYLLPWFAALQRGTGPPINSINTDSWSGVVLCNDKKFQKIYLIWPLQKNNKWKNNQQILSCISKKTSIATNSKVYCDQNTYWTLKQCFILILKAQNTVILGYNEQILTPNWLF